MTSLNLPVLSLRDLVVLPGMVVPVELDDAAQAAVDAARSAADGRLLVAPRLPDRYPVVGAVATIEQVDQVQEVEQAQRVDEPDGAEEIEPAEEVHDGRR